MTPEPLQPFIFRQIISNDNTLDDNLANLPPSQPDNKRPAPTKNAGTLDKLPLELLWSILEQLDLFSLTSFRRVNGRARQLVASLPQYNAVLQYAPNALRGILAIGTSPWITCQLLYEKLCTCYCEDCGNFGVYLYLLTCKRVCYFCISHHNNYLPLSRIQACHKFGLEDTDIEMLPRMELIPGNYSPRMRGVSPMEELFDYELCQRAGIALHGTLEAMETHVTTLDREKLQASLDRLVALDRQGKGSSFTGLYFPPKQPYGYMEKLRFAAVVQVPWLDKWTRVVEFGFHCTGCKEINPNRPLQWRRRFTAESYAQHLIEFGRIENGRHVLD